MGVGGYRAASGVNVPGGDGSRDSTRAQEKLAASQRLFGESDRGPDALPAPGVLGSAGQGQLLDQPHAPPVLRIVCGREQA
jgi:hypothetical protein